MKTSKWWLLALPAAALLFAGLGGTWWLSGVDDYQTDGSLVLEGLSAPVTVLRDEQGMATIQAQSLDDLWMAQGFVTAQDRLFQMELTRLFATGRISELAGEEALGLDTRMRTFGFHRQARALAERLSPEMRSWFEHYLAGVNAYVSTMAAEHPVEFALAGIEPGPWETSDTLAVAYYMSWMSSANLQTEVIAQMLVEELGEERAREIFPLNVHPEDGSQGAWLRPLEHGQVGFARAHGSALLSPPALGLGSNNWVVGPQRSASGKPILADDPHLDARMLPGPWHPVGLVAPGVHAVGVTVPGIPGLVIGRNERVAFGVTNAYADTQDLYVEKLDPADPTHYLEGEASYPFEIIEEALRYKDGDGLSEQTIQIRLTHRGPVVSEVLPDLHTDAVLSLHWAPFEAQGPEIGLNRLITAASVGEVHRALSDLDMLVLNWVYADVDGHIGWVVSGALPIRERGDGTLPLPVTDGRDDWIGFIPDGGNPQDHDPARGWLGTCNHLTVGADYPWYYSSHVSPTFRYDRLTELMEPSRPTTPQDHWAWQRDTLNPLARRVAPILAQALAQDPRTEELATILEGWDHHDDLAHVAPTVFQATWRQLAFLTFEDELGAELAVTMLEDWYFWEQRLQQMVVEGTSPWFDDSRTPEVEDRDRLVVLAGMAALGQLGADPEAWTWGRLHQLEFVSPIRRSGPGKGLLGGGSHPMGGSGHTLCRGLYDYDQPFAPRVTASLRMVVDLADEDKVMAVLPGGATARLFQPHTTDQIAPFMTGEPAFWWFSEEAVREHAQSELVLSPG